MVEKTILYNESTKLGIVPACPNVSSTVSIDLFLYGSVVTMMGVVIIVTMWIVAGSILSQNGVTVRALMCRVIQAINAERDA